MNQNDAEMTLKAFDGTCHNCGKLDHRSKDCKSRKKTRNFKGNAIIVVVLASKPKFFFREPKTKANDPLSTNH